MFGLEYDLDLFNIVAVDDFNMGERGCCLRGLLAEILARLPACAVSYQMNACAPAAEKDIEMKELMLEYAHARGLR